jgi:hypothetical protein
MADLEPLSGSPLADDGRTSEPATSLRLSKLSNPDIWAFSNRETVSGMKCVSQRRHQAAPDVES